MRNTKSYEIALSGISGALSLIAVTLAVFVEPMTLSFNAIAGVCLMLPLTKNYWKGGILSYVVVSILAFFIGNINSLPFIVFFGSYAVVQWLLDIKLASKVNNKIIKYLIIWLIKLAYYEVAIAILWAFMKVLFAEMNFFGLEITYLLLSLGGIILFVLYDILMHFVYKNLKYLVDRKIK